MGSCTSTIHASAFAYHGVGCVLMGESGAGKSVLLAQAVMYGAQLIADDQVQIQKLDNALIAHAVPELMGVFELRGLGLVRCPNVLPSHPIHLVVYLDAAAEIARLPERKTHEFCGIALPYVVLSPEHLSTVAPLLIYMEALQNGRVLPTDWHPKS